MHDFFWWYDTNSFRKWKHMKQLLNKGRVVPGAVIGSSYEELQEIIQRNPLKSKFILFIANTKNMLYNKFQCDSISYYYYYFTIYLFLLFRFIFPWT